MKRHIVIGLSGAVLLLIIYAGIITLAEGSNHVLEQARTQWYWLSALAGGFGTQAALYSFIRQELHKRKASTTASVATSGGVSAGSMVACCAHHVSDVLPLLGLSGMTLFLANYQVLFIIIGVLSNIIGITIMLETIQRNQLSQRLSPEHWNMGLIKKGTIASAIFILGITIFFTLA